MSIAAPIVSTLLREGYALYPYRDSAIKNRFRWVFGCCHPPRWSAEHPDDRSRLDTAMLLAAPEGAAVEVSLWFLQPLDGPEPAAEREVTAPPLVLGGPGCTVSVDIPPVFGTLTIRAEALGEDRWCLHAAVDNAADTPPLPDRRAAVPYTMASVHLVARVNEGAFASAIDPPPAFAEAAAALPRPALWPFLLDGAGTTMVASPIIVDDHPEVAPESGGDFFDGTEIDEMLTLRVLTMTEDETRQAAASSARVRALLQRCREMPETERAAQLGVIAAPRRQPIAEPPGRGAAEGSRVRLRPRAGADAFDVILAGRTATVTGVQTDAEGRRFVTVVIDGDPGADLGRQGQPGHRFFFEESEVELL